MTGGSAYELDSALRTVARDVSYPATPDMTAAVMERVRHVPVAPVVVARPARFRFALAAAAVIAVAMVATVGLSPSARRAVAGWLGVDGIRITFDETERTQTVLGDLFLGQPSTLAEAQAAVEFDIAIPAELGAPDGVYVMRHIEGGEVTLAWEPRDGLPASEHTDVGALLTQFLGTAEPEFIKKGAGAGTTITPVTVAGNSGFFIEGAPHVIVRDPGGDTRTLSSRLAGNTLLWDGGEVTYRLEADISLERAVEIAESLD